MKSPSATDKSREIILNLLAGHEKLVRWLSKRKNDARHLVGHLDYINTILARILDDQHLPPHECAIFIERCEALRAKLIALAPGGSIAKGKLSSVSIKAERLQVLKASIKNTEACAMKMLEQGQTIEAIEQSLEDLARKLSRKRKTVFNHHAVEVCNQTRQRIRQAAERAANERHLSE